MKIRPMEAEFFQADRRTDMTTLIVACRNFANAPKNFCNYSRRNYYSINWLIFINEMKCLQRGTDWGLNEAVCASSLNGKTGLN